jgi:hypothetical protein
MSEGRTDPPSGWRRLPDLARQLGLDNASACRSAQALARRDRAIQTATGRWYVEPEAFIEHANRAQAS